MKRLGSGGRIRRDRPITLSFDGRRLPAFEGDSLASALLASGISLVGRSFKYHRPRGIYAAGVEEPNAMVHLRRGSRHEPNMRATSVEAFDGLSATSQNAWPSRRFDIGAVNNLLSPVLSAGFYYKTFIGPFRHSTWFWMLCERAIRKAAGMGRASYEADSDSYEKRHAVCDVLVIGGGAAGLSAALAAGRAGADVIVVEQEALLGGAILSEPAGGAADDWLEAIMAELAELGNVRIFTRTTAIGAYDGDTFALIERVSDHLPKPEDHQVRQRYWQVQAKRTVLASGAFERPMVFGGNDKPGVMLAGAMRTYLNRYAVLAGERVVVFTNNNSAYEAAADMAGAGAHVTLVDLRAGVAPEVTERVTGAGVTLLLGHVVLEARGWCKVTSAVVAPADVQDANGAEKTFPCDLIATSAGWSPVVHLWSHLYGKPVFDEQAGCFVPTSDTDHAMQAAGLVMAAGSVADIVRQGFERGAEAARLVGAGATVGAVPAPFRTGAFWQKGYDPTWAVVDVRGKSRGKAFVDLQHDVKLSDIDQAHLEGYVSVEHLKRYTTLGMATDQGKLSNLNALSRMSVLVGKPVPEVGTTTFRPPFTPVTIGALVGHEHGRHFRPTRLSPLHHWHVEHGARMTEAGAWIRPWYYPERNESLASAYIREAAHVRAHVGMVDVSTLGKIAVQGPDAAEFLNRIYVNGWKSLRVGRLRYGVMLREDGFVLDDGATARLGEHDYFMTTTTANAASVLAKAEFLLQTAWRDLKVHVTSVTDQWAAIALAGPKARQVLAQIADVDVSGEALPPNHLAIARIGDVEVRVHRMSYSGELAYEIFIPAGFGRHVWERLYDAGQDHGLRPYGTEAMGALRIEKGHVAGAEIEGRTTLKDLSLEGLASSKKPFVGSVLRNRPVLADPHRPVLVGLEIEGNVGAMPGALLFSSYAEPKGHGEGWVSSATYSPALGKYIALALLQDGTARMGEVIKVESFVDHLSLRAKVVSHHFYDPEGVRQNA